jgi:6-phosphogluconolactonase
MLEIYKTTEEVLNAAAEYFVEKAADAIAQQQRFTVALSGGSSPKGLFELLASKYHSRVQWQNIYFFFGDERYVPATHPDSNALMAQKALFEPLNINSHQIFTVNTSLQPEEAAKDYQDKIEKHFNLGSMGFDLIFLGLGDDAHTASLFPHTSVLNETEPGVKSVFVQNKDTYRITFTAPLINLAHHIAFLVFGESKANAVHNVFNAPRAFYEFPAQLIQPVNGEVTWFMDEAAASKIKS